MFVREKILSLNFNNLKKFVLFVNFMRFLEDLSRTDPDNSERQRKSFWSLLSRCSSKHLFGKMTFLKFISDGNTSCSTRYLIKQT